MIRKLIPVVLALMGVGVGVGAGVVLRPAPPEPTAEEGAAEHPPKSQPNRKFRPNMSS